MNENVKNMTNFMKAALEQAVLAGNEGEVPVGAVVVKDGEIISVGRNRRERLQKATHHAEIEAIEKACEVLGCWRLEGCTLYVTLEPCPMCAGAIINARVEKVVYGATDSKGGACDSVVNLFNLPFNHKPEVWAGILEEECSALLQDFFKVKR